MKNRNQHPSFSWGNLIDAWGLFLLALVPLVFNFLAIASLDLIKAIFFQNGVIIFCLLVACQLAFSKFRPRLGKSFYPLLFSGLFLVSALIFSVDPAQSWWGSYERQLGGLTYLVGLLGAFFLLISLALSPASERRRRQKAYLLGVVVVASLLSVYALFQLAGFDIVRWAEPAWQTRRAFASLGQPTYFAGLLLLTIPVTLTLGLQSSAGRRYLFLILLVLQLLGLVATGTRSALFALVGALLIFSAIKVFSSPQKLNRSLFKKIGLVFLIIFLLIGALALSNPDRWQELNNLRSGSLGLRGELWREGVAAIREKPWLGYGLENQREAYIYHYDARLMQYLRPDVSTDRAHNIILDTALSAGIVGCFLLLLVIIFLVRHWRRLPSQERPLACGLLLSGLTYFLFLLFNFSVVSTFFYSSLLLTIYLSLGLPVEREQKKVSRLCFAPLALLIPFTLGFGLFSGARLQADYYYYAAFNSLGQGDYFKALVLDSYVQEKKIDPIGARYYRQNFTWGLIDHLVLYDLPLADKKVVLGRVVANPENEKTQTFDNRLFTAAISGFKGEEEKAQEELNNLLLAVPTLPKIYLVLGDVNCYNKNLSAATENWTLAAQLIPEFEPHWGEDQKGRLAQYQNMLSARQEILAATE
ncbi:MAG: O-antigen ligase family protein [Candidatus Parcubacteria bacterium]|nr:MAG: hypothetical protein JST_5420 [Candidatus Parcubacteria bacterium]